MQIILHSALSEWFSAAVTDDYYAEAWVLVLGVQNDWGEEWDEERWNVKEVQVSSGLKTEIENGG